MRLIPTVHITQIYTLLLLYTRSDKVFENFSHECHKMWFGCVGDKASQEKELEKTSCETANSETASTSETTTPETTTSETRLKPLLPTPGTSTQSQSGILKATSRKHLTKFRLQRSTNSSLMPPLPISITTCCARKSSVLTSHAKSITE